MISISQPLDQNCCTALDGVDSQFVYLGHSCASVSNVQALFRSISCGKDTSSSWRLSISVILSCLVVIKYGTRP